MAGRPKAARGQIARRRAAATDMRLKGATWQAIADALGYKTPGAACQDVSRGMEAAVTEHRRSVEAYREEELQRLDVLLVEAWQVLRREHVTVSHGRIVRDDEEKAILDDGPVLQAIDRILKIQERRAKLLGLDAPQRHEVMTVDAIDAEIARLTAELGGGEAGEVAPAAGAAPGES